MQVELRPGRLQQLLSELVYGGREASEAKAQAAMTRMAEERARQFREKEAGQREVPRHFESLQSQLVALLGKDEKAARSSHALRQIGLKLLKRKAVCPAVPKEKPRVFTGSFGSIAIPPCYVPYQDPSNHSGNPGIDTFANAPNGTMGFELTPEHNSSSSANVMVALGTYFYPPVAGHVVVQANPAYGGFWNYTCWLHHAATAAWIGLLVQQLDVQNNHQSDLRSIKNNI